MSNSYGILDVVKDAIVGDLEFVSQEIADERMAICNGCDVQNVALKTCTACGCFLPAKVRLQKSACPMELWLAVDL